MRFAYFYIMRASARVRDLAPAHAEYWRSLRLQTYEGGPFEDRTGGLIVFDTESGEVAEQHVAKDPFVEEDLLSSRSLKQWISKVATKEAAA